MSSSGAPNCGLSGAQALNQVPGQDKDAKEQSKWDKYSKCGFINVQHIDIYGRFHACYSEMKRSRVHSPLAVSVYSRVPSDIMNTVAAVSRTSLDDKLSRMSTVTKTSSLYPGHDILSKRLKGRNAKNNPSNFTCALVAR